MIYQCFATTSKGLEQLLINELTSLGANDFQAVNAGVRFMADFVTIMKINLHSRLASRVMLELSFGSYRHEDDIYNLASRIKWQEWFNNNHTIKVNTNAVNSPLSSLDFITLRVKDAICDSFVNHGIARPNVDKNNPDIRIYNFLTKDTVTIYLDTSGEGLFKRGYRKTKLEAPIKENLAAGLIQLSQWNMTEPFYDPMCGSGTIVIEALSMALNIAPGLKRSFAFEKFNLFNNNNNNNTHPNSLNNQNSSDNQDNWHKLQQQAQEAIDLKPASNVQIFASDISKDAIAVTKDNLETFKLDKLNLNLSNYVHLSVGDFLSRAAPSTSGLLLTNPPYGVRMDNDNDYLVKFYPELGNHLKAHFANWRCTFITSDLEMPKLIRLKPNKRTVVYNGALECRLFEFKMVGKGQLFN